MFWSDPNLYGATLPYKDVTAMQQPQFLPWQNVPRFVPPHFGFVPPYFGTLPTYTPSYNPFIRPETVSPLMNINPTMHGFGTLPTYTPTYNPFIRPETVSPLMNINPTMHGFGWNLPIQAFYRPFNY